MSVKFTDNSKEVLSAFDEAVVRGLEAVGITAEGHNLFYIGSEFVNNM